MSISIADIYQAASELIGSQQPSLKLALWASACSTQQALSKNGEMARLLACYVHRPLPDRDTLAVMFRQVKCFFSGRMLDTIYFVEWLEKSGQLGGLDKLPEGYEAQVTWRDKLITLVAGHGLSFKTISFAALLIAPLTCELVPVDRHVLARLGFETRNSPQKRREYMTIEARIIRERYEASSEAIPLALWHWMKWEEHRYACGASQGNGKVESHAMLSPCRY